MLEKLDTEFPTQGYTGWLANGYAELALVLSAAGQPQAADQAYRKVLDIDINIYHKNYFKYQLDNRWNSIKNIWKTLNDITSYNNKTKIL